MCGSWWPNRRLSARSDWSNLRHWPGWTSRRSLHRRRRQSKELRANRRQRLRIHQHTRAANMNNSILSRITTIIRVAFARLRFVAVFIIAAIVVGYWDDIKNHVDHWTRPQVAPDSLAASTAGSIEFFCPMHPDVVRNEAGQCPKCGMPLVKRKKGEAVRLPDDVLARGQLTPQRV